MVITKTPFRISFFGGGTDYPAWYRKNGGAVLSATIDKYCHIICRPLPHFFDHNFLIRYSRTEMVKRAQDIMHPSVRACLQFLKHTQGVEMVHTGDLPARSGLGSSSSFTVGLLHALSLLRGTTIDKRQLALDAIHIEQNLIGEAVGSQDQVAAAFGGCNYITFGGPKKITVQPLSLTPDTRAQLENHLMLFFTGVARTASRIARYQIQRIEQKEEEYRSMHALTERARSLFTTSSLFDCLSFGRLLHEGWLIKKQLSSRISTRLTDEVYAAAHAAGAVGGKVLGAGGGGFILFAVPPRQQKAVAQRLRKLMYVPFHFEQKGSHSISDMR